MTNNTNNNNISVGTKVFFYICKGLEEENLDKEKRGGVVLRLLPNNRVLIEDKNGGVYNRSIVEDVVYSMGNLGINFRKGYNKGD